ncbi:MAG: tetratricopeptide repeat protein [Desulfococcaceae bacterium]
MKNRRGPLAVSLLLFLAATFLCQSPVFGAESPGEAFLEGIRLYRAEEFAEAAEAFSRAAEAGEPSAGLCYNLGNAHLKAGDLGRAILWYERGLKRDPNDPDLRFNHEYALSLARDEQVDPTPEIVRILFFWKYRLPPKTVQWLAAGFNALFWLALGVRMVRRRRLLNPVTGVLLVFTLLFTGTALFNYWEARYLRTGVILPEEVSVRSGLTEDATELFVLHAGTKVRIEREREDHLRVRYAEGKIGWVENEAVGEI